MVGHRLRLRPLPYSGPTDSDRRSDANGDADAIALEPAHHGDPDANPHSVSGADHPIAHSALSTDPFADTPSIANPSAFVSNLEVADHCASAHVPGLEVAVESAHRSGAADPAADDTTSSCWVRPRSVWPIL